MSAPTRGRVSFTGIVLALVFFCIASVGFSGDPFWLLNEGTKWVVAGALALVGLGLVASTLPGVRRRSKS